MPVFPKRSHHLAAFTCAAIAGSAFKIYKQVALTAALTLGMILPAVAQKAGTAAPAASHAALSTALFVSDEWHDLTRRDGSGMYFDLVRSVFERQGIEVQFRTFPYARAVQKVRDQEADGWVASFLNEKNFPLYPKYHFDKNEQIIVFRKAQQQAPVTTASLRNKRVAWLRDFGLDRFIQQPMRVHEVDSIDSAFQMLERERIDYFVGAKSDIQDHIKNARQDMSEFGTAYALHLGLYVAFADNTRGKKLRAIWDKEMETFHQSEAIKEIYRKYGYPYPFP